MFDSIYTYLVILIAIGERILAGCAIFHAVLKKRETRTVIGWVGLIGFSPLIGSVLYFMLGVNRVERRGEEILDDLKQSACDAARKAIREGLSADVPFEFNNQLANVGKAITGFDLLPGNQVTLLDGGKAAYSAMLVAIADAEYTVALGSYIFDYDSAGKQFINALIDAQNRGVEVRVLIDHVGSKYSKPSAVTEMRKRGLKVQTFLPTNVPVLATYANLRNHRKILVIDGKTGFTGGMNISEGCLFDATANHAIQDVHFQFDGPVVEHLQDAFLADWKFAAREDLPADTWFGTPCTEGSTWARGIPDGPDADIDNIRLLMLGAISAAQRKVDIVTPYFLPESALVGALNVAAMRGVQVRILIPEKVNIRMVQWASMEPISRILERGCEVYQSPQPFDHTKVMLVDDEWSLVGSSNWDPRSLRLNFEFNVECYGFELNQQLSKLIDVKIKAATPLTQEKLDARRPFEKLRDGITRLATPYL